ncbi:unnamed protein product [Spirodela intermedia]|uniref:THIF-type NAD/FAD binding fold domain-containing protein n=1 Tax=Spirodela intermedia TaxID=51605 RepID=A0A7I8KW83_SPIIN|nr:unnamed protein product [Spirodela intermedia]
MDLLPNIEYGSRVLMVGAGGIGCELRETLALRGHPHRKNISSLLCSCQNNLNRQFLFRQHHVGKSKAKCIKLTGCTWNHLILPFAQLVARDAVLKFRPHISITPHHANVKSLEFNADFFKQFNVALNGLDNLDFFHNIDHFLMPAFFLFFASADSRLDVIFLLSLSSTIGSTKHERK